MGKDGKKKNKQKKNPQQSASSSEKMQPTRGNNPDKEAPAGSQQGDTKAAVPEQNQGGACAAVPAGTGRDPVVENKQTCAGEDSRAGVRSVRKSDSESDAALAGVHDKAGKSDANKSPSRSMPSSGTQSTSDVKPSSPSGTKTAVVAPYSPGSPTLATRESSPGLPTSMSGTTKVSDNNCSALADTTTASDATGTGTGKDVGVGKGKGSPSSPITGSVASSRPNREKVNNKKSEQAKKEDSEEKAKRQKEHCLGMSLEDKRKKYACGDHYLTLDKIPTWTDYFKENRMDIDALKPPRGKKSPKNLKIQYKPNDDFNRRVSMFRGDITTLEIDCIVNAANSSLLGGGGVDGAIHDAAGKFLYDECVTLKGCKTGEAKATAGYDLPAKYVIHTVGPIGERPVDLESCYSRCLHIMQDLRLKSIAFPCISTGVYGYPSECAVHVVLKHVREWMENMQKKKKLENIDQVIFCLFMKDSIDLYSYWMQFYFPLPGVDLPRVTEEPAGSVEKKGKLPPKKLPGKEKQDQDRASESAKSSRDAASGAAGVATSTGAASASASVAATTSDGKYHPANPVPHTTLNEHREEGASGGTPCSETAAAAAVAAAGDSYKDGSKGAKMQVDSKQSGKDDTGAFGGESGKTEVKCKGGKVSADTGTKGNGIDSQGKRDDKVQVYSKTDLDPTKLDKILEKVKDDKIRDQCSKSEGAAANNGKPPGSQSRFTKAGINDKEEYAAVTKKEEEHQTSVTDPASIVVDVVAAGGVGDSSHPKAAHETLPAMSHF